MDLNHFDFDKMKPKKIFVYCVKHGESVEALINGDCRRCRDEFVQKLKDEQLEDLVIRQKRLNGVPERYLPFTLTNYPIHNEDQGRLMEKLLAYQFDRNIVLLGKVGTGKSRIACSLMDKAIRSNLSCFYAKYYQLAKIAIEDKSLMKKLLKVKFLVIDEFGVTDSDYKIQMLFEIFDQRSADLLPTMLISNLNSEMLRVKLGDPLLSRIKEDCISFNCNWQDYRMKKE